MGFQKLPTFNLVSFAQEFFNHQPPLVFFWNPTVNHWGTFQQLYQPSTWCSRHQLPLVLKIVPMADIHRRRWWPLMVSVRCWRASPPRAISLESGPWGKTLRALTETAKRKALERSLGVKKNTVLGDFFDNSSITLSKFWWWDDWNPQNKN